jgi:hypothetical protein
VIDWFPFERVCAPAPDGEGLGNGGFGSSLALDALQPFAQDLRHRLCHAFAGLLGKKNSWASLCALGSLMFKDIGLSSVEVFLFLYSNPDLPAPATRWSLSGGSSGDALLDCAQARLVTTPLRKTAHLL